MAIDPKNKQKFNVIRKGEKNPVLIRGHDNDLTTFQKLIRKETRRIAPDTEVKGRDPFYGSQGGSKVSSSGDCAPDSDLQAACTVLHFNEYNTHLTPVLGIIPRAVQVLCGIDGTFSTPVFNRAWGQDRFTTPFGDLPDVSDIVFDGVGLNDFVVIEVVLQATQVDYVVDIPSIGIPDSFRVSDDGGSSWTAPQVITGGEQTVGNLTFQFVATTGHTRNDRWVFNSLKRIDGMGGGDSDTGSSDAAFEDSLAFRVDSDDDYLEMREADKLLSFPSGRMTVWVQGLDKGASDGNRNYFILDACGRFQLYYEYGSGVISRLVWIPNIDYDFRVELDIPDGLSATVGGEIDAEEGWFGYGPVKIEMMWDYSTQTFELYHGNRRALAKPEDTLPMPDVTGKWMSLGNSLLITDLGFNGGDENAFTHFDEWAFSRCIFGIRTASSIDGRVAQSLVPIHEGVFYTTECTGLTPAVTTPINLGSMDEPFDTLFIRTVREYCPLTPAGGVSLWQRTGTILHPVTSGDSASASRFGSDGDPDTYIDFPGTDRITIVAGGVSFITIIEDDIQDTIRINPDSLNIDFRMKSQNNINMLFMNSSLDRIGIGTGTLDSTLTVRQNDDTAAIPVQSLEQTDVDEPFMKYIGTAAPADLTRSIVDNDDIVSSTLKGWIKIEVQDDGDQIVDKDYFMPVYEIAAVIEFLLLDNGDFLLLDNGDKIIL